ncbi:MAG: alkaline phosphatase family protein [Myxococcota bacterium]|nr:alkaline phosphatase family protein [Deltaproteobacteria bacterium]MDQ3334605.1 alkaline phosphatase family protein [Myxococcota bacterium]
MEQRVKPSATTARVVAAAMALLLLGSVGGIQAGRTGASFMRDLEIKQPALANIAPWTDDPKTPRLARRVFLVIVDGLRSDHSYQLPFLDELRRKGVDLEAQSHYPSWSRPNYVSILTGVPPIASGVRTNFHYTPVLLDSLMDRARAAGLKVATATDHAILPSLFLRPVGEGNGKVTIAPEELEELDIDVMQADPESKTARRAPGAMYRTPFHDARYVPWPGGFVEAGTALVEEYDYELVVLLVSTVDIAGHAFGADSEEYLEATQVADRALARVLSKVDLSQDAILVTSDHGHTDAGGHGGTEPEVLTVPLILAGAGVANNTIYDARLIDLAPTVAALLGFPAPGHGLGKTLVDLVALDPDARLRRVDADRLRLLATTSTLAVSEARAQAELLEDRTLRFVLVASGSALAIVFAVVLYRRRVLRLDLRVLAVAIPAFFLVYYTLIGTLGQRFSPSLLPAQGHITTALIKFAIIGMAVQLLASLWVLRKYRSLPARLAAANGIAWTNLMLSMIPAGLLWAFFPGPSIDVPGPKTLVMIPAVQLTVAATAIDVALVLFVELIVFAARARFRYVPGVMSEPSQTNPGVDRAPP